MGSLLCHSLYRERDACHHYLRHLLVWERSISELVGRWPLLPFLQGLLLIGYRALQVYGSGRLPDLHVGHLNVHQLVNVHRL